MATVEKRGETYRITVSCGYDTAGKQIRRRMTWTPEPGMTKRQEEKELRRQADLFEEKAKQGTAIDGNIKFADFAALWFDSFAMQQLRPKTVAQYKALLPRVNAAIGHMRMDKIQPLHLLSFYKNLSETGIRNDTKYRCKVDLKAMIKAQNVTQKAFAASCGVSISVIENAIKGGNIGATGAGKICSVLGVPLRSLFDEVQTNGGKLSDKTIKHYHNFISSVFSAAVEWGTVDRNPCDRTKTPKTERKSPKYLDEIEAAHMLDLLEAEPIQYRTMIRTLLFTGMRRAELLGLNWSDVDFDAQTVTICRSSLYLPDRGIYADETKTASSERVIKCPPEVFDDLRQYRKYQTENRLKCGDRWTVSDRIFTQWDGKPVHPDTLSNWFRDFIKKTDLPDIPLHSLRHTNATLQIANGVPVTTVSSRLGHATANTTTRIYAHAIKSADEAAAETLSSILNPKTRGGKEKSTTS